jgi:DNA invertase Pin-like site-specific DNA recombinase
MQIDTGAGLAAQEDICKAWASKEGMEISQTFTEKPISGAAPLDKRPALFNAIYNLEEGDILLVSRLDRLSRDLYGGIIIDELVAKKKARVVSAAGEGTEGEDPCNQMMKNMFRVVAGFERNLTQFRIKSALAAKKARGERVGFIPFGYELGDDRKLRPKPEDQPIIEKMIEYRQQGLSMQKICDHLNASSLFNRNGNKWNVMSMWNALKHTPIGTKNPTKRIWA